MTHVEWGAIPELLADFSSEQGAHWAEAERDNMMDDIEELEIQVSGLVAALHNAKRGRDRNLARARAVEAEIEERVKTGMDKLVAKVSAYSDIILEYERTLTTQSHEQYHSSINKIEVLKKQGGLK